MITDTIKELHKRIIGNYTDYLMLSYKYSFKFNIALASCSHLITKDTFEFKFPLESLNPAFFSGVVADAEIFSELHFDGNNLVIITITQETLKIALTWS